MKGKIEWFLYSGILIILSFNLIVLGKANTELRRKLPVDAKKLFSILKETKLQIIDIRPEAAPEDAEEGEDESEYRYYNNIKIPGSIAFPGCDIAAVPAERMEVINPYQETIIVSADGEDLETYKKCAEFFKVSYNLIGGVQGWVEAGYPEDEGEYTLPPLGAGGGCL